MAGKALMLATFALIAATAQPQAQRADTRSSLGGPLTLSDFGSFFVGGCKVRSDYPNATPTGFFEPGEVIVDQMYVQYQLPAVQSGPPIVLVHGFGHTGATFETSPTGGKGGLLISRGKATPFTKTGPQDISMKPLQFIDLLRSCLGTSCNTALSTSLM